MNTRMLKLVQVLSDPLHVSAKRVAIFKEEKYKGRIH